MQQTLFCNFRPFFCSFTPLLTPKIKIWKKYKNDLEISSFYRYTFYTISQDHMMHSSWDIKCKRQSSLSLWALFPPLTLLTTEKIKILKKWKKPLEILSSYTRVPQIPGIWCMVPEISSATDIIFCYFGLFFCPFTPLPLTTQKI